MRTFAKSTLTVIGILTGTLIAFFAWIHPFKAESRALEVSFPQNVKLFATPEKLQKGSLQFIYQGSSVQNLVYTKIRFHNNGNVPLEKQDFIKGVEIDFPLDTQIISLNLSQAQPTSHFELDQGVVNKISSTQLNFVPELINPGEVLDLDVISTRFGVEDQKITYDPSEINLKYEIYGISKINVVSNILTDAEKKAQAQEKLNNIFKWTQNPLPVIGGIILYLVFMAGIVLFLQFPQTLLFKKIFPSVELQRILKDAPMFILSAIAVLFFLYFVGEFFYDAWFL